MFKFEKVYDYEDEYTKLAKRTFALIELIELAGIKGQEFLILRRKILNIGNDIIRLKEGENNGSN